MNKLLLLTAIILLVGCASTGSIQGVSNGQAVQFDYEQGFLENDGSLLITMPDGERYAGKFVQGSTSSSGDDWVVGESSNDDSWVLKDSTTVSSRAEALLIGDQGATMKCRFQFSNADAGIEGGGIGQCKTSKGQKVSITF